MPASVRASRGTFVRALAFPATRARVGAQEKVKHGNPICPGFNPFFACVCLTSPNHFRPGDVPICPILPYFVYPIRVANMSGLSYRTDSNTRSRSDNDKVTVWQRRFARDVRFVQLVVECHDMSGMSDMSKAGPGNTSYESACHLPRLRLRLRWHLTNANSHFYKISVEMACFSLYLLVFACICFVFDEFATI